MSGDDLGHVTGRFAGSVSRLAAFAIDSFAIVVLYGVIVGVIAFTVRLVTGYEINTDETANAWWLLGYILWAFLYFWISTAITGRTFGKWLIGTRIVERDGSPLRGRSAFIRVLTLPLSFLIFGLGFVGIVIGEEHRALHDVFAGTVVVYDWGDRPAEMPAPLTRFLNRREALAPDSTSGGSTEAVPEDA